MNNIFLFDIDGTLSLGEYVFESALKTINKIKDNGDIVLLASGRAKLQMKDVFDLVKPSGAICNNGAYLFIGEEVLFESEINKAIINEMINDGLHLTYLSDKYFRVDDDKIYYDFADWFKIKPAILLDKSYLNEKIYSLGVQDYHIENIDISKYPLKFVKVSDLGFDVFNLGISKASPIKIIKEKYKGYKLIAFGDNYNDLEMLNEVDIPIVMGNAPEDLKSKFKYITKRVDEDGIEYAYNHILKELL